MSEVSNYKHDVNPPTECSSCKDSGCFFEETIIGYKNDMLRAEMALVMGDPTTANHAEMIHANLTKVLRSLAKSCQLAYSLLPKTEHTEYS